MQKEVNEQYHEKIYMYIEPKIVKLQRMYRRGRLRVKVKLIVNKAMKFYNIMKIISRFEKQIQVHDFKSAMGRMAQRNDYHMCARAISKFDLMHNHCVYREGEAPPLDHGSPGPEGQVQEPAPELRGWLDQSILHEVAQEGLPR